MRFSSIFILLIVYILGIIAGHLLQPHWSISFTLWITSLFSLIIYTHYAKHKIRARAIISGQILLVFFLSGSLGYVFRSPSNFDAQFVNHYLNDDVLTGEIVDFQEGKGKFNRAIIEIKSIEKPLREVPVIGNLLCYVNRTNNALREGDIIQFQPKISTIQNNNNPGEFDGQKYWKTKGVEHISFISEDMITVIDHKASFTSFWSSARERLIKMIKTKISPENQGLVIGLSLGDKSSLSTETKNHFSNAGVMHVLAVSGMHVGILLGMLQIVFKNIPFLRKRNLYLYFALVFLWVFAFITGLPASVSRAVLMFSILAVGQLLGKRFFSLQTIFASALILLIINPLWIFDIGFQLSYLAVISIGLFYQPILRLYNPQNKFIKWLWEGSAIGIAAQIGTVPISLLYFHQFPNYFFLSNLGMLFLASGALISVVVFLAFHYIPYVGDAIAWGVDLIFTIFNQFIAWINTLPAVVSTGFTLSLFLVFFIYLAIAFTFYHWKKASLRRFNIGILALFFSFIAVVLIRENNMKKEELVVLNHYNKTLFIKGNRDLLMIYNAKDDINEESLQFMAHGYETSVGVKSTSIPLNLSENIQLSPNIKITNTKEGMYVNYYDQNIFLANKVPKEIAKSDTLVVKGSWNRFLNYEDVYYNTMNEALILRPYSSESTTDKSFK